MALVVAGVSVVQGYVLARSAVAASCPADTTEDVLATITVPAGVLGISGVMRVTTTWTMTSSGNNKTPRIRFSGTSGTAYLSSVQTTITGCIARAIIANRGAAGSQSGVGEISTTSAALLSNPTITSAVDTTAASSIVISGQKASSGETLTLESYLVELFPTT